jgi:hypothetical protein
MLVKRAIETKGAVADCETVLQASNEYKKKQDVMSQFIEERIDDYQLGKYAPAITFQLYCIRGVPYTFSLLNTKGYRVKHFFVEAGSIREMFPDKDPMYNFEIPSDSIVQEMLKLAGDLSAPFEFVRMDFYLSRDQKIYLSEFTFTPNAGRRYFSEDVEMKLGKLWT